MSKLCPEWIPLEYCFWPDYSELDNSIWKSFCVPWLAREKTMLDLGKYPSSLQGAECFSPFWPHCCWTLLQPEFIATNWKQLAAECNTCRNKVADSFSRKAQKWGFVQASTAHKKYEAEQNFISSSSQVLLSLEGKTSFCITTINLRFLCRSGDLCNGPKWADVATFNSNRPPHLLFQGTQLPQFETLELVIIPY